MNYLDLLILASPEAVLALAALVVLGVQAARPTVSGGVITLIAVLGLIATGFAMSCLPGDARIAGGMLIISPLGSLTKVVILALAGFTVLLARSANLLQRGANSFRNFGEYVALVLLATIGLMLLVSTEQLLVMFVGLELAGLSLYVMTAFDKADAWGAEAGLKYFLFGSIASAFTLFGLSLLYGMTGATNIHEISSVLALNSGTVEPLLAAGVVMTLAGLAFKIAAAPFHLWVGDTYEAAPVATSAFIASASKVAAFFLLGRLLLVGLAPVGGGAEFRALAAGWAPAVAVIAAASIILGNLVALNQLNFRRMLAYSAVAHAGYTLIGLLSESADGFAAMMFYTVIYGFTLMGTFGIVAVVRGSSGSNSGRDAISDLAGLRQRSPLLAACLAIFLLSLAGLPPLAGFFGKFYLFATALNGGTDLGLLWLVLLALAGSLVSIYYYLGVLKVALVDPAEDGGQTAPSCDCVGQKILIAVLAALVLMLGIFPDALLALIVAAM